MFRLLSEHPQVVRPTISKGTGYFDDRYQNGFGWYRAHFPLAPGRERRKVTFESSGYYSFHPLAPRRIGQDLPGVHIVMMVRDPVERAYSAYKHEYARGYETETFARALELEDTRLLGEADRIVSDPVYRSFSHRHQAYKRRGHYADQLLPFIEAVGRSNVHVVDADRFFADPTTGFVELQEQLGLSTWVPPSVEQWNARPSAPLDPGLQRELRVYFDHHDTALEALLGRPLSWR